MKNIYTSHYIRNLFDNMSASYEIINMITSFGFSEIWRWQCIRKIELKNNDSVADLMTGMGESWHYVTKKIGNQVKLIALDFSSGMLAYAHKRQRKTYFKTIK